MCPLWSSFRTLSALNSSSAGVSTFASTALPLNYSSPTLTIGEGSVQVYSLLVPNSLILTANISVSVTPSDANCNPDLAMTYAVTPGASFTLPLFNSNTAPTYATTRVQSYSPTGRNAVQVNATTTGLTYSSILYQQYWFQVTGTIGGSFQLTVTTTVRTLATARAIPLALSPSLGNYTASGSVVGTAYSIALPTPVPTNMDLFITVYTAGGRAVVGNPLGTSGGAVGFVACMDVLPPTAAVASLLPTSLCQVSTGAVEATAVVFNSQSTPSLQSGSIIYVYITAGNPYTVTLSYQQRQQFVLGGSTTVTTGSLQPGQCQALTLSIPAVQVGGQWSTNANFVAAVDGSSTLYKPSSYLYMDVASNPNTPLPFSTSVVDGHRGFYDRSSTVAQAGQSITVTDLCLSSTCLYTAVIYAPYALNYSFEFQPLTPSYTPIIPGFTTVPTFIATDTFSYFTFSLPHQAMTVTVTLTSLVTGSYAPLSAAWPATTNADLFVSYGEFPYPDYNSHDLQSLTDTSYGVDSVTITFSNASGTGATLGIGAARTYYVSVFGQRGGYYTLSVTALDTPPAPMFITNNQPLSSSIALSASDYYTYNIGQVTSFTDLSIVLSSSSSAPSLYATFSYTHPGPVQPSGVLPALLPYEMYSRISAALSESGWLGNTALSNVSVQQITLTSSLSSSNVLPLQSQTSLYVAVFGGNSSTPGSPSTSSSPYSLSVSLSKRLTLTTQSGLLSSWATFTPVSAGTVQYYQMTWMASALAAGAGAIIAVTGSLTSSNAQLPFVFLNDPTLSTQVDPVMSSSRSYTTALINVTTTNARMVDATSICPSGWTTCLWKALVYSPLDTPGYTIAVNSYQANDQTPLTANENVPVTTSGFVWAGNFNFFVLSGVTAAMLPLTLTVRTLNQDGNMDLYMSMTNTHPSAQTSSIQSLNVNNLTEAVQLTTAGTYYLGLFGQQTSQYQMTITAAPQSSSAVSSSPATSSHSSSPFSSSALSSSPVSSSAVSSSKVSSSVASSSVSSSMMSSSPVSSSVSSSVASSSVSSSALSSSVPSGPASSTGVSTGGAVSPVPPTSGGSSSTDMTMFIAAVVPLAVVVLVLCLILLCIALGCCAGGTLVGGIGKERRGSFKAKQPPSPPRSTRKAGEDTMVLTTSASTPSHTQRWEEEKEGGGVELEGLPARRLSLKQEEALHLPVSDSDMTEEEEMEGGRSTV